MIKAILTIDDIASSNTPALVDYLVSRGIKALMFAEGAHIEKYPDNVIYAIQHGMVVGFLNENNLRPELVNNNEIKEKLQKNSACMLSWICNAGYMC